MTENRTADIDPDSLARLIKRWAVELGFQQAGISDCELGAAEARLMDWLGRGMHGEMGYMARHGRRRARPAELQPGTLRVISVRMDYLPADATPMDEVLARGDLAYVSRYALGRDYHKLVRRRLQQLADRISAHAGPFGYRAFCDSAPVLEKPLAEKAGLGWIGKHTNLLTRSAGSWFFLGELYTDLPLPIDAPHRDHCGTCSACIEACPTGAIVEPYLLDARRCISYLTIEHAGSIPEPLRPLIGNRIYGCDDCQWVCPWNRFARESAEPDFAPRHGLDAAGLLGLFAWDEATFLHRTEGTAIRRIGHARWQRNIAVALGNAPPSPAIVSALEARAGDADEVLREHVQWALSRQHRAAALTRAGSPSSGSSDRAGGDPASRG